MIHLLLMQLFFSSISGASIVDTFTFHCAPSCQVYLDGVSANSSTKIETGLTVDIPAGTKVIAVNVYRKPLNAGFVGSSNHGVKTDLTWKCVRTVEHPWVANQNWQDPAYDDSLWPYANFYQYNNVRDVPWWPVYKDINNVAMWIGMGYNRDHEGTSLFCRKKIGHTVTVDCDDSCILWVDGIPYATAAADVPLTFDLPQGAKVIAVDVDNTINQPGGLILSSNQGLVSDSSWKCTSNTPPSGWQKANFDDSSWSAATWMFNDGKQRTNIDSTAKWIGSGCASASAHFYCRKRL